MLILSKTISVQGSDLVIFATAQIRPPAHPRAKSNRDSGRYGYAWLWHHVHLRGVHIMKCTKRINRLLKLQ